MALSHWFIPHKDTHKKAHLISWQALLVYALFFILLQVGFSIYSYANPGVLGISSNIDQKRLIELTNIERQKMGLSPVIENTELGLAAKLKGENMIAENYWAHFAPSGKTPWDFILGAGYHFTFAGENLAKNFYSSEEVVNAWMNSPAHRDNLLNGKYKDIGIAVVEGNLDGQKTTLVIQEFGTTEALAATPAVDIAGTTVQVPAKVLESNKSTGTLALNTPFVKSNTNVLVDPFWFSKIAGYSIILLIIILLSVDLIVLKKRGVFRLSSHHIAHMALLSFAASSLYLAHPGVVL